MSYDALERSKTEGSKVELYLFETEGGVVKHANTTDSVEVVALGYTFIPTVISRSEFRQTGGENSTERLTIKVPFDHPVALMHVPYLPPRPVQVRIYSYHRRDMAIEIIQGFVGSVTNFTQRGEEVELQVSQIIDSTQQTVPWAVFKSGCVWATYEQGCGVQRESFRLNITVASFASTTIQSVQIATKPNGWFTAGYAVNTANGETRFITEHVGDMVKLVYPFTGLTNGTVLAFYAGDDHQPETCRVKFNNKANYLGFDFFPKFNPFVSGTYNDGGTLSGGGGQGGGSFGYGSISLPPSGPSQPPIQLPPNNDL